MPPTRAFAEPGWNADDPMTSDPKLKLGRTAIGGEEFGHAGGEAAKSRQADAEAEVERLLEAGIPQFDLSHYANYETTERGWRVGFTLAFVGSVWLFFEVLAIALFASSQGPVRATALGTMLFGLVMLGWGALYWSRRAALGNRGLVAWLWDGFFRNRGQAPPLDEAPAQLLRVRGRPREAIAEYERLAQEHPDVALITFRMAEIEQKDLRNPERAAELYRIFIAAASTSEDEQELEASAWAEVQLAELERG